MAIVDETNSKQGNSRRIEPSCLSHSDDAADQKGPFQSSLLSLERLSSSGSMISDGSDSQISITSLIHRDLSKLSIGAPNCSDSKNRTMRDDDVSVAAKGSHKHTIVSIEPDHNAKVGLQLCRYQFNQRSPRVGTISATRSHHSSISHQDALAWARRVTKLDGEFLVLNPLSSQIGGEAWSRLESFPPITWDDVADQGSATSSMSMNDDFLATINAKEAELFPRSIRQEPDAEASWSKRKSGTSCSTSRPPPRSMKRCKSFGSRLCTLGSLGPASFSSRAA